MNPIQVRKAVTTGRKVVPALQYYTEIDETIYCLIYSNHWVSARLYLHYDPQGRLIARALMTDGSGKTGGLDNLRPDRSSLDQYECVSADFHDLLLEMHLVCCSDGVDFYDQQDLQTLVSMFSRPPIIIGGCGRSGTSLLLSVLGAHPSIYAIADETYAFYPRPLRLRHLLHYLSAADKQLLPLRWCEKTPKNVRAFGDILSLLGCEVRLIHIVRDGRDVITSVHPNHPGRYWIPAERWIADVTAGLEFEEQSLLIRYEDLVLNVEETLHRICDYIGEPFDTRMLSFSRHTTVKQIIAWGDEAVRPLDRSRVEKWRADEHKEVVDQFMANPEAAALMRRLRYT